VGIFWLVTILTGIICGTIAAIIEVKFYDLGLVWTIIDFFIFGFFGCLIANYLAPFFYHPTFSVLSYFHVLIFVDKNRRGCCAKSKER
jgi:uncharacterized membrane protein YeaQ/YmgE (transglycosylase-associated protein family)